jgi:hypothetical protein
MRLVRAHRHDLSISLANHSIPRDCSLTSPPSRNHTHHGLGAVISAAAFNILTRKVVQFFPGLWLQQWHVMPAPLSLEVVTVEVVVAVAERQYPNRTLQHNVRIQLLLHLDCPDDSYATVPTPTAENSDTTHPFAPTLAHAQTSHPPCVDVLHARFTWPVFTLLDAFSECKIARRFA